jgi:23S rRNA pseudouridine1911/1915/1917 synthase
MRMHSLEFKDVINSPYFTIIEETDDYIVVDKPPHSLTHPSKPGQPYSLWDGLKDLLAYELACGAQLSIINRLDRETSGLVLVAKKLETARLLHEVMAERTAAKEYLAVVIGWPEADAFMVDQPLRKRNEVEMSNVDLQQMCHPEGAASLTEFRVEQRFTRPSTALGERFALVRALPHTGRMHQIRVHLAHAGYPIVGDKLYIQPDGNLYREHIETGWTPQLEAQLLLSRHALHSARLEVPWADGGRRVWEAPLPRDLEQFLGLPA